MSQVSRHFDPAIGPALPVLISDPLRNRDIADPGRSETVLMLIDTGASDSAIRPDVVERLGLRVLGLHDTLGFGAARATFQYLADLEIPLDDGRHTISDLPLLLFETNYDKIDGLLGRDVLATARFEMSGIERTFRLEFPVSLDSAP